MFKVALDGGFDCPNRDGTVALGGCTFCSAAGAGDFAGNRADDLMNQFDEVREECIRNGRTANTWRTFKHIRTRTLPSGSSREIRDRHDRDGVVGLSIATRPDCLPDDVVEYLAELNERTYLWVELGLQTVHERTANLSTAPMITPAYVRRQ